MKKLETAVFGGGCFWCTEAIFSRLKGVEEVVTGYAGGVADNPTYYRVVLGNTRHAEVIRINFDPDIISYETLLDVFWNTHNPTTLNRQGNDSGSEYRSVIFFLDQKQERLAVRKLSELKKAHVFADPIVTEIQPLIKFYPAESYHQNYFGNNPDAPYCQIIISPKLRQLREKYSKLMK